MKISFGNGWSSNGCGQDGLTWLSSLPASAEFLEKAVARFLISFQESGMVGCGCYLPAMLHNSTALCLYEWYAFVPILVIK